MGQCSFLQPKYNTLLCFTLPETEELYNFFLVFVFLNDILAQTVKNLHAIQETQAQSLGWEDPLEKGMATHSSFLAWKTPRTEELGRLQSMGCKESDTTEVPIIFTYWPILVIMRNTGTRDWKSTGISLFFLRNITLCMCERQREEREFFSNILRIICKK